MVAQQQSGLCCSRASGATLCLTEVNGTRLVVEVAEATHEGVSEAAEVTGVPDFLGENVAHVVLADDVGDLDDVVLDPLADLVFLELHVSNGLQGHVVGPEDG